MTGKARHYVWSAQPLEQLRGNITRRYVTSDAVMIGEVSFRKGDTVPAHRHENEQFTHVVRGRLKFILGDDGRDEIVVGAGEIIAIPPNLLHGVEALEDTLEYDVFNPPRQDWIDPASAFLRG